MLRALRLTLMWLLAFALPVQGVSAATMLACGLGHHDSSASQISGHTHVTMSHVHAAKASAHEHGGVARSEPGKTDLGEVAAHKCSACASCCLSAVATTDVVAFDTIKLPEVFAPLVARSVPAYMTEGLERPPRAFLA